MMLPVEHERIARWALQGYVTAERKLFGSVAPRDIAPEEFERVYQAILEQLIDVLRKKGPAYSGVGPLLQRVRTAERFRKGCLEESAPATA